MDEHLSYWWMGMHPQGPVKLTYVPYLCFWFVFGLHERLVWQVEITRIQDPYMRPLMPLPLSLGHEGVVCKCVLVCLRENERDGAVVHTCLSENNWPCVSTVHWCRRQKFCKVYVCFSYYLLSVKCVGVHVWACVATCRAGSPQRQKEAGWQWCDVLACALGWFWCGCHFVVFV